MTYVAIRARTIRRASDVLRCDVRKVYGYQGECGCGWTGHVWANVKDARLEASFHQCERKAA